MSSEEKIKRQAEKHALNLTSYFLQRIEEMLCHLSPFSGPESLVTRSQLKSWLNCISLHSKRIVLII